MSHRGSVTVAIEVLLLLCSAGLGGDDSWRTLPAEASGFDFFGGTALRPGHDYLKEDMNLPHIKGIFIERHITWRIHQTPSRCCAPARTQVIPLRQSP
ncbi:MAG: hypothetical protein HN368_16075 [Spirochaetales bacterium]|nr:hypothetical protein [Spirochaetales bacterium]